MNALNTVVIALAFFLAGCGATSFQFSPGNAIVPMDASDIRLRLASRSMIAAILQGVFGPDSEPIVKPLVRDQYGPFGGDPCDRYAAPCGLANNTQLPMVPFANALRFGLIARACERLVSSDQTLHFALSSFAAVATSPPGPSDVQAVFELFYPGKQMSSAVASDLQGVVTASTQNGHRSNDTWRILVDTVCQSPGWQLP
jgi:hypothetical protein